MKRTEDVECPGVLQVTTLEGGGAGTAGQGLPGVLHQRRERERGGGGVAVPCRLQQQELKHQNMTELFKTFCFCHHFTLIYEICCKVFVKRILYEIREELQGQTTP